MSILLCAMLLGLSVAAPVGPIGILCIRRTLSDGRLVGLACGLGAATADALYGLMAGLGMTAVSAALTAHQTPIRLIGAVYLGVLGFKTLKAPPAEQAAGVDAKGAWRAWASTLFLTLTNPMTILAFVAMFAALNVPKGDAEGWGRWGLALLWVVGVFVGSALWWLFLSFSVGHLRGHLTARHLQWVNRSSGTLLLGFAAWALWKGVEQSHL